MPAGSKPQGDGLAIIFSAPSGAGKTTLVKTPHVQDGAVARLQRERHHPWTA